MLQAIAGLSYDAWCVGRPRWRVGRAAVGGGGADPEGDGQGCPRGRDRARLELELGEALWAAGDPAAALAAWERSEAALQATPEEDPAPEDPAPEDPAPEDPATGDPTLRARVPPPLLGGW